MIDKIKVYILASPHPQFDEILDFPIEGVEYEVSRIKTAYHSWFTEKKIDIHNKLLKVLPIPRMIKINTDADIIHSTRGIIQIKPKKPWIIDLESGGVFTSFNYPALKNPITKRMIIKALASDKCKKILPQSEAAKKDLLQAIDCSKFRDKIKVLYLAMRPCKKQKVERNDNKFIISYIGKEFYFKGGRDLLQAYEILTKKYPNLELKFKGDVPEEYKDLKLSGLKFIKGFFPRDELFDKMYLTSDVFVMPTHSDNYGVVFLEAMSAGLPVIGTTSFTVPELIEEGKNGFLIKTPYSWENYFEKDGSLNRARLKEDVHKEHNEIVRQLVEKLSILIEDKELCEKMGKRSREIIETGKLSIAKRNEQLKRIYKEALK